MAIARWLRRLRTSVRRRSASLPALDVIVEVAFEQGSFVAPQPWQRAIGRLPAGQKVVCQVGFGVSPLCDRIYVDGLAVAEPYRRQGYASALLKAVVDRMSPQSQKLPVTALHEVWASTGFWSALREGAVPGLVVTRDVRASEMAEEARRWRDAAWRLGASSDVSG